MGYMIPQFSLEHWEVIAASALVAFAVVGGVLSVVTTLTLVFTREPAEEGLRIPTYAPTTPAVAPRPVSPPPPAVLAG
jgi:hypothetical protein